MRVSKGARGAPAGREALHYRPSACGGGPPARARTGVTIAVGLAGPNPAMLRPVTAALRPPCHAPLHLVFGASGYVGSHLVPRCSRKAGACAPRPACQACSKPGSGRGAELVEADALKPETLDDALRGVDTAYYLVHSMVAGRRFGELDREAAVNFAAAAARCGVRQIVYLGGLIPPHADSEHLLSRKETGDKLREGSVPVIELRAGIIVGPGSAAYEVMRDLVYHLPVMVTPRWVQSKSSPVAIANLVEYLIRVADLPQAQGRILDAGGPEYLVRGHDAPVRGGRRQAAPHPARPGPDAAAFILLAGADYDRPRPRGPRADRRFAATTFRPSTRNCARWYRNACSRSARRSRRRWRPSAPTP